MSKRSEKITFTGADGESQLAARLDRPEREPIACALFAHCFTCSKDVFAAARIAAGLVENGIAVLRFDFTGLGASEGEFANTNFSSNVGDLIAAAAWMRENLQAPSLLIGHSLGGAAVLAAAADVPEAKAVVTVNAPADPGHLGHLFTEAADEIAAKGEAEVTIAGRPFRIQQQFLEDIESHRLAARIKELRKALLVFHAPRDQIVGIDNATEIFIAARHPKSFISLDDADHLLSRREDAIYVADVIAAWAARYIDAGTDETRQAAKAERGVSIAAEKGTVVVAEAGEGTFANVVSVGGTHTLRADEPATLGGTDTGPSPYDYLLAGLGACTTMTMRLYAERKKIPLERASVTLTHAKIHAEDCATCETREGRIDRIERVITLKGGLTDEQRRKLLEISEKCPVHRTLHSEVSIETELSS